MPIGPARLIRTSQDGDHRLAIVSVTGHSRELIRADPAKFRAAERHSRHVRLLRKAIPVAIALVFALLVFEAYFNPFRSLARLKIDVGKIGISGTRITMGSPRYAGFTHEERPYEVTARAASQDITKPDIIDLEDIWAKVELQDKATVEMTAARGVYDSKQDRLTLSDQILLHSSTGYAGRLQDAIIEVKKGSVLSESPVEVTFLNGTSHDRGEPRATRNMPTGRKRTPVELDR